MSGNLAVGHNVIPESMKLPLIFLAEEELIAPGLAWESPLLRIHYCWLQLLGKGLHLQNSLQVTRDCR